VQANNRDFNLNKFFLGPDEQNVAEGFDALYKVEDSYTIPPASGVAKQQLVAMQGNMNPVKGDMSMETAMSNIFGRFGMGQREGNSQAEDFLAPPRVDDAVRSPLQVVSNTAPVNIVLIEPRSFEESVEIVSHLKQRKSVIVNLQQLDAETSQRVLDFVSGATYAMDGTQERVGNGVFIFASINCRVESESQGTKAYKELFSKTFGV
jgi:cell division inhibitor SepF